MLYYILHPSAMEDDVDIDDEKGTDLPDGMQKLVFCLNYFFTALICFCYLCHTTTQTVSCSVTNLNVI